MMIKKQWRLKVATLASAVLLSMTACGNDTQASTQTKSQPSASVQAAQDTVSLRLLQTLGERPSMVVAAPMPGFQMAVTSQGNFFVSDDGRYMVYGRIFDLENEMTEVTNTGLNTFRADKLESLKKEVISYPAFGEVKHNVYVFTDITCGYCRKLHREIQDYQKAGISIHYLAYPRSPDAAVAMQKIWCADDPVKALSDAKISNEVVDAKCNNKPETVAMQHQLGVQFGVNGTPAMVLEDGTLLPGYRPAKDLLKVLDQAK